MTIEAWEHVEGPKLETTNKDGKSSTKWVVRGAGSTDEASAHLSTVVPIAVAFGVGALVRQSIKCEPQGAGIYFADVTYGPEDDDKSEKPFEPLEWKYSFDTTGAKHKKMIAEKERSRSWCYSSYPPPPDLKGAINYDGKKVNGVEVIVPNLEFELTVFYAPAAVTVAFVQELARKTGRMNSDPWLGFQPGEALFMGATGDGTIPTLRGQRVKPVPIRFKFGASQNRDDLIIGSNPDPITKRGWDYLWIRYERMESSGLDYPVPVHAYVDQVYPELAFRPFFKFG